MDVGQPRLHNFWTISAPHSPFILVLILHHHRKIPTLDKINHRFDNTSSKHTTSYQYPEIQHPNKVSAIIHNTRTSASDRTLAIEQILVGIPARPGLVFDPSSSKLTTTLTTTNTIDQECDTLFDHLIIYQRYPSPATSIHPTLECPHPNSPDERNPRATTGVLK
ncbi:hypothetical protein BDZ45DRAFT_740680 [Acephala macrosclerotiorum]|nr:hypothetical protein BDZ45DRAFT_740680 [Acephala macrosclerotiorum]